MAMILVITDEHTYRVQGDSFHTQKDIGQIIISQRVSSATEGNKTKTVAAFNCNEVIGVVYGDNFK